MIPTQHPAGVRGEREAPHAEAREAQATSAEGELEGGALEQEDRELVKISTKLAKRVRELVEQGEKAK